MVEPHQLSAALSSALAAGQQNIIQAVFINCGGRNAPVVRGHAILYKALAPSGVTLDLTVSSKN